LIPLDGARSSERILGPLGPLLHGWRAEVTLLRVLEPCRSPAEDDERSRAAAEQLGRVAAVLEHQQIEVVQRSARGDPAEEILRLARELRPRLLAMSTHGRSGLERLLRGSVAERVLRKCPVPLFLCNPRALARDATGARFRRILVPLDGSERADAILPLVQEWAQAYRSTLTLLRVQPLLPQPVPAPAGAGEEESRAASLESPLALQREGLAEAGLAADVVTVRGDETSEILAAAEQADLVAMTTQGRGGIARWWLGSVAEAVTRRCPCPLLLLRPEVA